MNTVTKEQIKNDLYQFVTKVGSQNAASKQLTSVSNATISNILAGKWDNIAEPMWLSIQNQVKSRGWMHYETTVSRMLSAIYADLKQYQEVRAIVAPAGSGKTHTAKRFCSLNANAFHIECDESMSRKDFLMEIITKLGITPNGRTIRRLLLAIVEHVLRLENPIFFFDEFDKLENKVFYFFISLYNKLEDKAAIVLQSTPYLKNRIATNVANGVKGYEEILSRVNSNVVELPKNRPEELKEIARLNGVSDELELSKIVNIADGNIRRIKTDVRVFITKQSKKGVA